jgi:hypothetical protein
MEAVQEGHLRGNHKNSNKQNLETVFRSSEITKILQTGRSNNLSIGVYHAAVNAYF